MFLSIQPGQPPKAFSFTISTSTLAFIHHLYTWVKRSKYSKVSHRCHDQDSNPHSGDLAPELEFDLTTRTELQLLDCAKLVRQTEKDLRVRENRMTCA